MQLAAVLAAALLSAAEPAGSAPASPAPEPRPAKVVGVLLSVGAPDGFGVGAFVRPIPWMRADGGFTYNVLSFGVQGGVTVMPWSGRVTPTLRLGLGQTFETDVRDELGDTLPDAFDPALEGFGYRYYTAQLGLEVGSENGMQFFVRGGFAWVRSDLESTTFVDGDTTITANRNELSATTPSVQLGLIWHLW